MEANHDVVVASLMSYPDVMPCALCLQLTSYPDSHASLVSYPDSHAPCFVLEAYSIPDGHAPCFVLAAMESTHDVMVALVASLMCYPDSYAPFFVLEADFVP